MDLAPYKTLVDAMIEPPQVVTKGVREQMVKPATERAGSFAMKSIADLTTKSSFPKELAWSRPILVAIIALLSLLVSSLTLVHASSATSQLRVTARVVHSCNVSSSEIKSQAPSSSGTLQVNCQNGSTSTSLSKGNGVASPSSSAIINYRVDEVPGSDGTLRVITVNY